LVVLAALAAGAGSASAEVNNPQLSAGAANTCAIYSNQKVYCWGSNLNKQLGIGNNNLSYALQPIPVNALNSVPVGVSTGYDSACAMSTFGTLRCWGNNANGALGAKYAKGNATSAQTAATLTGAWVAPSNVATGQRHICWLDNNKTVKCQGANASGQLGNGANTDSSTPVQVSVITGAAANTQATQVVTGSNHSCALLVNRNVKCWGANNVKQLGTPASTVVNSNTPVDVPDLANDVRQLASGGEHTCAIRANGDVICWGSDSYGELGDGTIAAFKGTVAVDNLAGNAKEVTTGISHSCALLTNGSVRCWGANTYGQLGTGGTTNATRPVTVAGLPRPAISVTAGGYHTCARLDDQSIRCWGKNDKGQLGNNSRVNSSTPVAIAAAAGPSYSKVKLEKGNGHTNFVGLFVVRPPVPGSIEQRCVGSTVSTVSVTQGGVKHSKGIRAKLRVSGTKCVASLRVNNISSSEATGDIYIRSSFAGNSRLPAAKFTQTFTGK
jgi:alpha-tubulin suppressor-like RCC1 family protein